MDGPTAEAITEESLRRSLHRRLMAQYQSEPDTLIVDELGLCQGIARVDVAVINGQLHGYEIKSERDSLRRLGTQAVHYNRVFDRVTLVCSGRHVSNALEIIPSWWGVLQVISTTRNLAFEFVRAEQGNPQRDARAMAEFLWSEAAIALLEQRQALRGLRGKPRAALWDKICELLSIDELAAAVCAHLKATAENRGRLARQS